MSNYLAVATVTATLREVLLKAALQDVPGSDVTTQRPDDIPKEAPDPRVNIYLYQVTPNAAYRNCDLPTRNSNSDIMNRPKVALDLHYLITVYGNETTLEPQRLLGSAVRTLHEHPVLTRKDIRDIITKPLYNYLATSNLADDVELVKFTSTSITLEELSKLWSVFFQIPYALSVSYMATVVLIESEESPKPVLPVRERNLIVLPFRNPVIEKIISKQGKGVPITTDSTLLIQGERLSHEKPRVRMAGELSEAQSVTDKEIEFNLKEASQADKLRAGIQSIQVVHVIFDRPPDGPPSFGFESNVAAFILRPLITSDNISYDETNNELIVSDIKPVVSKTQRVLLLLNQLDSDQPESFNIKAPSREEDSDMLKIPLTSVLDGTYLVRVQIDGAESLLETDEDGRYIGPKVTVEETVQFKLTTNVEPAGGGNITASPQKDIYSDGEMVELTAVPATDHNFEKWDGDIANADEKNNPLSLKMDQNRTVTAHFSKVEKQFTLTVSVEPAEAGTVTIDPEKEVYDEGESVQITAVAQNGFTFVEWGGDLGTANPNDNPLNITMDQNRTITAHFEAVTPIRHILSTEVQPEGSGVIRQNPDKTEYDVGEQVELTAEANSGFGFDQWSGDLSGIANPQTILMDGDKNVTAQFSEVVLKTIISSRIEMSGKSFGGRIVVGAVVFVRDGEGNTVEDAAVSVKWSLPDSTTQEQTSNTDNDGKARFGVENCEGEYCITVNDIEKEGYQFDPNQGETEKKVTI